MEQQLSSRYNQSSLQSMQQRAEKKPSSIQSSFSPSQQNQQSMQPFAQSSPMGMYQQSMNPYDQSSSVGMYQQSMQPFAQSSPMGMYQQSMNPYDQISSVGMYQQSMQPFAQSSSMGICQQSMSPFAQSRPTETMYQKSIQAEFPQDVPKFTDKPEAFPTYGGHLKTDIKASDNLSGDEYDLGTNGAFSDFSVLVMMFIKFLDNDWLSCAGPALGVKGFTVKYCKCDEVDTFLKEIDSGKYQIVWIISSGGGYVDNWLPDSQNTFLKNTHKEQFLSKVIQFHQSGGGLFLWGDNEPYYYEMNLILCELDRVHESKPENKFPKLSGNTYGDKILSYGNPAIPGEFDEKHIIFSGINYLYEGVTICYPILDTTKTETVPSPHSREMAKTIGCLDVLATSSNGKPVILKMERKGQYGRILIDSGWTKLYRSNWSSVGQARYVVNACVWLVDAEVRDKK